MSTTLQQQILQRKLIYIGVILALFVVTLCYRNFILQARAEKLAMREVSRGDVELGGSALRLVLTGSRGLVVCVLSYEITRAHEKNQWNKEELITRYLTKLQPHYIQPWLYHSWNLAYNVSVEEDRVRDRYYFMTRGIELLAEGERQNRNNPDLRWNIALYYQDKIGRHDEKDKLNCLFQMSLIDPLERDPARFYRYEWTDRASNLARVDGVPSRVVDRLDALRSTPAERRSFERADQFQQEVNGLLADKDARKYGVKILHSARILKPRKFIEFCKRHPQLVRRLRDRCLDRLTGNMHKTPEAVLGFLEENHDIPSIFSRDKKAVVGSEPERDADVVPPDRMKLLDTDDIDRFPVLPLPLGKRDIPAPQEFYEDRLNSDSDFDDDTLDAFAAARTWYAYAQEPLPKPDPTRPGFSLPPSNRITERTSKHMNSIIFRNCPPRAQTFICDRLVREGWFERWDLSDAFDSDPTKQRFPAPSDPQEYKVGKSGLLKETWQEAFQKWKKHGENNNLLVPESELARKEADLKVFQENYRHPADAPDMEIRRADVPEELRAGLDAGIFIRHRDLSLSLSNFNHFYYQAMVEKEDDALLGRRYLFEGDNLALDSAIRVRKYEVGLEIWRNILLRTKELRADTLTQESLYEYQLKYLYNYQQMFNGGKLMKRALLVGDLMGLTMAEPAAVNERWLCLGQFEQFEKNSRDWPAPFITGPLDTVDDDDTPLISDAAMLSVANRFPDKAIVAGRPATPEEQPTSPGGKPGQPGGRPGKPDRPGGRPGAGGRPGPARP